MFKGQDMTTKQSLNLWRDEIRTLCADRDKTYRVLLKRPRGSKLSISAQGQLLVYDNYCRSMGIAYKKAVQQYRIDNFSDQVEYIPKKYRKDFFKEHP